MEKDSGTIPNVKYKDSFFTVLFSSKENLLELYKVLHPEDTEVTVNDIEVMTIKNVLLIRRYNDAAIKIRDKLLVLSEHQSTLNPNMPVRLLFYIVEEYEKIIKEKGIMKALYSSKQIELPAPEFYVIYTGNSECGEYMYLKDAFPEGYKDNEFLQLKVKVITSEEKNNILGGYISFVKKAEELKHTSGYTFTDALKEAIQWCRREGILADFIEERSEEMMSLMLEEWNIEDALKYNREDAWEEGLEQGRREGRREGKREGREEGKQEGMKNGMVYAYYEMNLDTKEIAKKTQLTETEVIDIIKKRDM